MSVPDDLAHRISQLNLDLLGDCPPRLAMALGKSARSYFKNPRKEVDEVMCIN